MKLHYFGTDLNSAGHYFFEPSANSFGMHSRETLDDFPFNCERLPVVKGGKYAIPPKGMTRFYRLGHWSICAIGGSAKDQRPGCKSVFFWDEVLTDEQMIEALKAMPIFNKMIEQMPFPVEVFKPANSTPELINH